MADPQQILGVQCTRYDLRPGDRIIARVARPLSPLQRDSIRRSIEAWAGIPLKILIIDNPEVEIKVERDG